MTKEEIANEGWNNKGNKGEWHLKWFTIIRDEEPINKILISRKIDSSGYIGDCTNIEQFRQICKFLHI